MQDLSASGVYAIHQTRMPLPAGFPVWHSAHNIVGDRPINFLHVHDCLELGRCDEGSGIFNIAGRILPFRAGDLAVVCGQEAHFATSHKGTSSRWRWIWLDPSRLLHAGDSGGDILATAAFADPAFRNLVTSQAAPEAARWFDTIYDELERRQRNYQTVVRGAALALLGLLHRLAPLQGQAAAGRHETMARIAPALHHLAQHYDGGIRVADLAKLCRVSPQTLWRLFQQLAGCSPQRYLTRLRMQMAAALLLDPRRSVLGVSLAVGYGSVSSFNRHFKTDHGISPRTWRQRML